MSNDAPRSANELKKWLREQKAEGADDYPTNDEGKPLCVGKEEGQCERTVDEPNGVCWQH